MCCKIILIQKRCFYGVFRIAKKDNYEPAKNINPEIHIRYGLGNGQVRQIIPADNGVLFITDLAISPPSDPSKSLNFLGCSKFQKAIEDAGLMDLVDGLRGVTMYSIINIDLHLMMQQWIMQQVF